MSSEIENLDKIYSEVFGDRIGTFLEIGAFDGESFSNTSFLADNGWEGYYFEPLSEIAIECAMRHINNNVKVIPCAVSNKDEILTLSLAGMMTSARKDHVEIYEKLDWGGSKANQGILRQVTAKGINTIIKKLKSCDLLVIDIEGFEPVVMNEWDFSILKPKIMIIETRDEDPDFPKYIQDEYRGMVYRIIDSGYKIKMRDGTNLIFQGVDT